MSAQERANQFSYHSSLTNKLFMSKVVVVVGAQWGDEGKGKIVDLLAERFEIVARYQGGHNAGHSVYVGDRSFVLRLLPSGIVHPEKTCVLGNGMVIDPKAF